MESRSVTAPDTVVVVGGETGINGGVGVHLYRNGMPLFDAANTRWATNAADYFGLGVTTAVATSPTRLYAFNGWDAARAGIGAKPRTWSARAGTDSPLRTVPS